MMRGSNEIALGLWAQNLGQALKNKDANSAINLL
jgi:hypothetical protein